MTGRRRYGAIGLIVLVLALTGVAGYRVLAPTETVDPAHTPYPAAQPAAQPVKYGELHNAALVVDNRLRVYAAQRRVWADTPITAKAPMSPYWSYRRWPAQVLGVVAVPGPLIVSKWSDGYLIAIDARTGRVAWRTSTDTASGDTAYQGRKTGALTVYQPPDLYTAVGTGDRTVVVSVGTATVTGYDPARGARLWSRSLPGRPACRTDFTGPGIVVSVDTCDGPVATHVYDALSGAPRQWPAGLPALTPAGCRVGRSECTGMVGSTGAWLIGPDGSLTASTPLAAPHSWLVGTVVVTPQPAGKAIGYDAATGAQLWSWPAAGLVSPKMRIIAVEPGLVHVLTSDNRLVTLDARTGQELSYFLIYLGTPFGVGTVYASNGYVFIERLRPDAKPGMDDARYYYQAPSVQLVGS